MILVFRRWEVARTLLPSFNDTVLLLGTSVMEVCGSDSKSKLVADGTGGPKTPVYHYHSIYDSFTWQDK